LPTTLAASEREIFSVLFSCCCIPPAPCSNYLPLSHRMIWWPRWWLHWGKKASRFQKKKKVKATSIFSEFQIVDFRMRSREFILLEYNGGCCFLYSIALINFKNFTMTAALGLQLAIQWLCFSKQSVIQNGRMSCGC
jgi:hypothetical protein